MPCVPSYHEQMWNQASLGLRVAQQELERAADITNIHVWVDGEKLLLTMGVSPGATASGTFPDTLQYALHVESSAGYGQAGERTDIICTFDAAQTIQCWIGDKDYVTGDASAVAGLVSESGAVRVHAGPHADPTFFNLAGLLDAVSELLALLPALATDPSGCPALDAGSSNMILNKLKTTMGQPAEDFYANSNVLALVLELDKSLVTAGGPVLSVWGSTHEAG
jgi:hypothetical protein